MKKTLKKAKKVLAIAVLTSLAVGNLVFADSSTVSGTSGSASVTTPSDAEQWDDESEIVDDVSVQVEFADEATPSDAVEFWNAKGEWAVDRKGNMRPGWISWDTEGMTEEEHNRIWQTHVWIYKGGDLLGEINCNSQGKDEETFVGFYFRDKGDYSFRAVYLFEPESGSHIPEEQMPEMSEVCTYTPPSKRVPSPTGLNWATDGTISWNKVTGGVKSQRYWTELYRKIPGSSEYEFWGGTKYLGSNTSNHMIKRLKEGEDEIYKFKVIALGDLIEYDHSESEFSPEFYMGKVSEVGKSIIEGIANGDVKDNVENTVLSSDEKGSMKLAVQADKEVARSYEELEETYKASADMEDFAVETNEVGLEQDKIKVVGGILNGATGIKFEKPSKEELEAAGISASGYQARASINISLDGAGDGELNYPVLITMPVPTGIKAEVMWIIHMKHDGTKDIIHPRVNGDGTVSFAVTEFSIFHFAVAEESGNSGNTGTGTGSSGGSGGGSGRSSATKAVATTPQTSGSWLKTEAGWQFQKADGSVYVNEWLYVGTHWYYAGQAGQIVEGWQLINNYWYYFTPANGDMRTGWVEVDGKWYYLQSSGAMLTDAKTPDGYYVGADGVWTWN